MASPHRRPSAMAVAYTLKMILSERLRDDGSITSAEYRVKPLTTMMARS
jgi:hypothetical protein